MSLLMKSIDCLVIRGEEFKDLPGFEELIAVSSFGRVYTYPRTVQKYCGLSNSTVKQNYKGRLLNTYKDKCGYIKFRFGANGKKYSMLVSRAMLMAFVGQPKLGQFACHNDSNPENNKIENLRWDFQKGNMKDRQERGLYPEGENHHAARVPICIVKKLKSKESTPAKLAKETGFSYRTLWRIAKGHTWKNV